MVILNDITNPFFARIVRTIELTARSHGYHVLLFDSVESDCSASEILDVVTSRKIDGVIFLSSKSNLEEFYRISKECPIVLAGEYVDYLDIPSVSIDNIAAAIEATNHLISLGHRDILYMNTSDKDRLRGYLIALELAGIPIRPELQVESDWTYAGGYAAMEQALRDGLEFSAVFCVPDVAAIGAIKALRDNQVRVPEDVSVIGFDGIEVAEYVDPALTTISQPLEEIGRQAFELWLSLMSKNPLPYPIRVPYNLVRRDSCAPYRER